VVGLGEHSGLNLSRLQGTQAFWQTADLQECDILHRSQSEPLEGDAGHKIAQPTKEGDGSGAPFELLSGFNLWPSHEPPLRNHDPPSNHPCIAPLKTGPHDRGPTNLIFWGLPQ